MGDLSELGDYDIEEAPQAEDIFGGGPDAPIPMNPDEAYLYNLEQHLQHAALDPHNVTARGFTEPSNAAFIREKPL